MKVFTTFSPALRRNLLVLFTAGLLFWAGLAALLPTLPLYIKSVGASDQAVGLVMGAFAIGLIPTRAWLSRLADQRGRKIVLLIGMTAVAVAPLGYLLSQHIPTLVLVRAFHGISIAAFALAYSAIVVDLSPPQYRGEVIGYMSLVNPIGVALGPAIGGFSQEWFGFTPMFLIAAGLGVLGLACTAQVKEAPVEMGNEGESSQLFWSLLWSPRIRVPAIVLMLTGLAFGCLSTFVPLYLEEAGVTLNAGLFYTAAAIASFGIRLIVGPASDRYGRGVFISLSLVFYTAAMAMLWQATNATMFLLAGVLEGMGAGILIPMMAALMADRSHPNERGRTFGICMLGFDAGVAVAGPMLGMVASSIQYRGLFGITAALVGLGLLIFLTRSSKTLTRSLQFALGQGKDAYAVDVPQQPQPLH